MPRDEAATGVEIAIAWRLRTSWRAVQFLRHVAQYVTAAEGFHTGVLSIAVVGARAMATLHERFAGVTGPTDVLTFDLDTDPTTGHIEGEIVVCADVARRNAARRARTLRAAREELALYITHGVLHLAGYDDHEMADYAHMHAREDELLAALGLGAVFTSGE